MKHADDWPAVERLGAKKPQPKRPVAPGDYDVLDSVLPGDDRTPDGFRLWEPGKVS